jgi:hypothetical protein
MKHINKLVVIIVVAVVIGFLLAGVSTKITYTCAPPPGTEGCVSFDKAVMHPQDLLGNKQDSLVQFAKTFTIASVVAFALFSAYGWAKTKKKT